MTARAWKLIALALAAVAVREHDRYLSSEDARDRECP